MRDRTVVITGAGTGIGAACAKRLAAQGANLGLIGRRAAPLEALAAETGGLALAGDAGDSGVWAGFIERIELAYGGIDALICCAGGHGLGAITEMSDDDWQTAMHANLTTAFQSTKACLPSLTARSGSIVLLGSIAGLFAGPGVCGYTTAKHALIGLTRSLARDYGPHGVRVNCVCPGWVRTPTADEEMRPLMTQHNETLDDAYARVTRDVPLRRPAEADEIARVCDFLIGPGASVVTGATLVADGGASTVDVPTLAFANLEQTP